MAYLTRTQTGQPVLILKEGASEQRKRGTKKQYHGSARGQLSHQSL